MNKIGLLVAAALGGAAVYWYIKRTCPCQHAGDAAHAAAGAVTSASSLTGTSKMQAGAVDPSSVGAPPVADASDDYGDAATAAGGNAAAGLDFDPVATPSSTSAGITAAPSSFAGASSSSCTSCSGGAPAPTSPTANPFGVQVFEQPTTAIVDPLHTDFSTVLASSQVYANQLTDAATLSPTLYSKSAGYRGAL